VLPGTQNSILGAAIDAKARGGRRTLAEPFDCIESDINIIVSRLAISLDPRQVDAARVVQVEYGAKPGDWGARQMTRAEALGLTLRTYERRLNEAVNAIEQALRHEFKRL
jgi:hypothetical protein